MIVDIREVGLAVMGRGYEFYRFSPKSSNSVILKRLIISNDNAKEMNKAIAAEVKYRQTPVTTSIMKYP